MKRRSLFRLASLALCLLEMGTPLYAGDTITYQGKTYPNPVDLNHQYRKRVPLQKGGSCHIFAAVALVEAACYRYTKKKLDLSEAYLFSRHLRVEAEDHHNYRYYFPENEAYFTLFDGGKPFKTIQRIFNGSVCTEAEFPFDRKFVESLRATRKQAREQYHSSDDRSFRKRVLKEVDDRFCEVIDGEIQCRSERPVAARGVGYLIQSDDPDLQECLRVPMKAKETSWTLKRAIQYLSNGIPFICSSHVTYASGGGGQHAFNVVGYRFNSSRRYTHQLEFKVRDSNDTKATWGWNIPQCDRITVITRKN